MSEFSKELITSYYICHRCGREVTDIAHYKVLAGRCSRCNNETDPAIIRATEVLLKLPHQEGLCCIYGIREASPCKRCRSIGDGA